MAASNPAQKRKYEGDFLKAFSQNVIIIPDDSDLEDEVIIAPAPKRLKSETSTTNGSTGRASTSRDASTNGTAEALPSRPSTPDASNRKPRISPWVKRSPYAHHEKDEQRPRRAPSVDGTRRSTKPSSSVLEKIMAVKTATDELAFKFRDSKNKDPKAKQPPAQARATSVASTIPKATIPDRRPSVSSFKSTTQRTTSVNGAAHNVPLRLSQEQNRLTPAQQRPLPMQARIEVVVQSSQELLQKFRGPVPKSMSDRRNAMLKQLKKGPTIALENPEEARRLFGDCFSRFLQPKLDDECNEYMKTLASKKARMVSKTRRVPRSVDGELTASFKNLSMGEEIVHPAEAARQILTSRFDEQVTPPLTFTNEVNEKRLHGKFQFVDRYVISQAGIKTAPARTNYGCDCSECHVSCKCFTKDWKDNTGQHIEQKPTYTRRPDGVVVLSEQYLAQELDPAAKHFEITECNELCKCGPDCWNRVVGKGRTLPLEIFQTEKCGFGVRSSQDIVKGQFIDLYLGEVITEEELRTREDAVEEAEPSYIYSLDWFSFGAVSYHVDGKYFGSAMRFINHSCNPNARSFIVQVHKGDKRVYYLPFFAIKDIKAGTEITIDYKAKRDEDDDESSEADNAIAGAKRGDAELADGLIRCQCGEKNCRKFLWKPGVKSRRKKRED
ncbi:hypothetical protein LTR72_001928 [Exophiala xenobiotica]|nr:hypothetical protein LTR72_001928 [Exophiala xenobiotica]KAK5302520.1 hypothetical protein LTR14_000769 [Exophiala xenobiotica]KAK5410119.1 hypothetical protein LTR06_006585 [Exophiala xenobiotica]KAK5480656.1 hypothetical protein LTR55_007159 [Exophiala xenobiotica]